VLALALSVRRLLHHFVEIEAGLVWLVPDLVRLNIAAQVLNAFLLPLVVGFLVALAITALPEAHRLRGWYLWALVGFTSMVCALGLVGGLSGFL
jgi:hypothetical protein